jgi:hypothetical protein
MSGEKNSCHEFSYISRRQPPQHRLHCRFRYPIKKKKRECPTWICYIKGRREREYFSDFLFCQATAVKRRSSQANPPFVPPLIAGALTITTTTSRTATPAKKKLKKKDPHDYYKTRWHAWKHTYCYLI